VDNAKYFIIIAGNQGYYLRPSGRKSTLPFIVTNFYMKPPKYSWVPGG